MIPLTPVQDLARYNGVSRPVKLVARWLLSVFFVALAPIALLTGEDHAGGGIVAALSHVLTGFGLPYSPTFFALEFLANIVLFVPLGLLMPLALGRIAAPTALLTVTSGLAVSLAIETAQLSIEGRVSDPRDLVSNTLGTAVGVAILLLPAIKQKISAAPRHHATASTSR